MDLMSINPNSRKVPLVHPATEEEVGLTFILRSRHSPEVQAAQRKAINARLAKKKANLTAEAAEAAQRNLILAAVEGWEFTKPDATINGERPEFSRKALKQLIDDGPRWIREFLDSELGDDAAFYDG